jgi:hypothetical protein
MSANPEHSAPVDVTELVWAMLDEQISDADFQRLDDLLRDDETARRLYLECVQMHVDLKRFFTSKDKSAANSPVGLPLSLPLPISEATLADPGIVM